MAWVYLMLASACEIGWALGLKYSEGLTKLVPSVITLVLMILTYVLLAQATKSIPLGTAYAIWTGIGAAGAAILGMMLFQEPATWPRIASVGLIVAGIVCLKLATPSH